MECRKTCTICLKNKAISAYFDSNDSSCISCKRDEEREIILKKQKLKAYKRKNYTEINLIERIKKDTQIMKDNVENIRKIRQRIGENFLKTPPEGEGYSDRKEKFLKEQAEKWEKQKILEEEIEKKRNYWKDSSVIHENTIFAKYFIK